MRPIVLMLCLALGGCVTADANVAADVTGSTPAAAVATAPSADAREAQASDKRKEKRQENREDGRGDEKWKEGGVTREKINAMCWMKYENGRRDMPVEKRADLVDECVQQTLKEHPLR